MELELGNLAFNTNKNQRYRCPDWVISLLRGIESELDRVMWNINQKDYESPFENTGNEFIDLKEIFEIQAYSWNDDVEQDYNFIWRNTEIGDIKISWYKYLGRDTTINVDLLNNTEKNIAHLSKLIIDLYDNSIKALRDYESKNLKKEKKKEKLPDYEIAK